MSEETSDRRALLLEAQKRVQSYDVYRDFPGVPELIPHRYTPTSVMVTGAAGFIASHVAIRLARLYPQYRVIGVDKMSYCSDAAYVTAPLAECSNFRFVQADVCDFDRILQVMEEEKVDTVLHLAAQSHVDLSFKPGGPRQFTTDNVVGTASLIEAARKMNVRRFVYCSTDEVYGEGSVANRVEFDESTRLNPMNPYSASKAGGELMAMSFFRSFGFPVVVTRGNNVYGPHQFYEKLIPKFIAQLKSGRPVTVHGSGGTTRNFLHVQDTACAFDVVLHCGEIGEAYNIGGKNEKSVLDVAADILTLLGLDSRKKELIGFVPDRAHNDACYPITNAKLRSLGWREQLSWEFGLANTASFFADRLLLETRDLGDVLSAHPGHSSTDATFAAPRARL